MVESDLPVHTSIHQQNMYQQSVQGLVQDQVQLPRPYNFVLNLKKHTITVV